MPTVTPKNKKPGRDTTERKTIIAHTTDKTKAQVQTYQWWTAQNDKDLCHQVISTGNYLQKTQQYRVKGASIFSRIYSGKGLMNYALNSKILDTSNQLPVRRPTMDTLVSRLTQNQPRPVFLTNGGDYRERNLADHLNDFVAGELFRTKGYDKGKFTLRDSCVFGDGFIKVFEQDKKVALERRLTTELYTDKDDSWYGEPRQMIELKLSDRNVVAGMFPKARLNISKATKAYVDGSGESSETIADQIILIEAWHRASFVGASDGRHVIVCSEGVVLDEKWDKDCFPFVKMAYNPHSVGYFSQGLVECLMGTQLGIDTLLRTISEAMHHIGVPRVFIDEMSKILETSLNNNVGSIIKYRGSPPTFHLSNSNAPDIYEHLMRLISFAYQISGISQLSAGGVKPPGLNSGEAQRVYMQNQDDRFASLAKQYDNFYVDLAYQIIDVAKDIAERDGSYTTVYPNKDGTREVDLPRAGILKDTYIIQCYDESALPRDPAGRYARLSEMLASNEISLEEFRSLSAFPDLKQSDNLANALRNRILSTLDNIVKDGTDPVVDAFMLDPTNLAMTLGVAYINTYSINKLEEKKMGQLRDFITQIQGLQQMALPPPPEVPPGPDQNPNAAPPPAPPPVPQSAVSQAA
jgi:hypothetical protein